MMNIKGIIISTLIGLALIIIWHLFISASLFVILVKLAVWLFGDLNKNEGFLIAIPIGYGSILLGIIGLLPAYFSYNFLLKKLTARFGMQVDRPKRLFVFSAFLIYGLPFLLLFWALVKP